MKNKEDHSYDWNDAIQKMSDEGMFNKKVITVNKLETVKNMLNGIMLNGLAVEECSQEELMDYICEIKQDIQNIIDYIEGE